MLLSQNVSADCKFMTPLYKKHYVGTFSGEKVDFGSEALDFTDTNNDGHKDILVSTTGRLGVDPISDTDPRISIIHLSSDFSGELADTSRLEPTGWINDFIFTDQDSDGFPEIIGNDHGRELKYNISDWNIMKVFEWEPKLNGYAERTKQLIGNNLNFYHGTYGVGDVNNDGLDDIFVGSLSANPHTLFTGDVKSFFINSTEKLISSKSIYQNFKDERPKFTSAGVAGVFDYGGDDDYDLVSLPYNIKNEGTNQALIFEFEDGKLINIIEFNPRMGSDMVPKDFFDINESSYGFSTIRFGDINKDGLQDIVAYAENSDQARGEYKGAVVSILQSKSGMKPAKAIPNMNLYFNLPSSDKDILSQRGGIPTDSEISLIDLDADGDLDLLLPPYFDGKSDDLKWSLFFNDGSGKFFNNISFAENLLREITWTAGARVAVNDFNSDSLADYVVIESFNWTETVTKQNEFGTLYEVTIYVSNTTACE